LNFNIFRVLCTNNEAKGSKIMRISKVIIATVIASSIAQAIPIEQFKSKNGARFNNFGVTMKAKIRSINCNHSVGYGKKSRRACRVSAQHKMKGQRDQPIFLTFDKYYEKKLRKLQAIGNYRFVSCTYTHKKKLMGDCSIK
jgi:hypothetical protein